MYLSINRNILECKVRRDHAKMTTEKLVLIETYWNVKMDDMFLDMYYFFVLIETYWNVKKQTEQTMNDTQIKY